MAHAKYILKIGNYERYVLSIIFSVFMCFTHFSNSFAQFKLIDLIPQGSQIERANYISDSGWVVGYHKISLGYYAYVIKGQDSIVENLLKLPGYEDYLHTANAVNSQNIIVGMAQAPNYGNRAIKWEFGIPGELTPLPGYVNAQAEDINIEGVIVGGCWTPSNFQRPAVQWVDEIPYRLESLSISSWDFATCINDSGVISGYSKNGDGYMIPVIWGQDCAIEAIIGVLPGDIYGSVYDINNLGQVVGWSRSPDGVTRGFLWDGEAIVDLSFWLTEAISLNDKGDIVGGQNGFPAAIISNEKILLPTSGPGYALSINNKGLIVGISDNQSVMWQMEAVPSKPKTLGSLKSMFR